MITIIFLHTRYVSPFCKSRNFCDNFIFANSVKRHICDAKNSRQGHDLHKPVNDRVISAFREDFIFTKLRICEVSRKYIPRQNFRIYSIGIMRENLSSGFVIILGFIWYAQLQRPARLFRNTVFMWLCEWQQLKLWCDRDLPYHICNGTTVS